MPKLPATHRSPAEKPTALPKMTEGRGPRKLAKFQAARKASTSVVPKINGLLPEPTCASVRPASRCQVLPNRTGEYHRPPSTKHAMAATTTASQLIPGMRPPLLLSPDSAPETRGASWKNGKSAAVVPGFREAVLLDRRGKVRQRASAVQVRVDAR